MIRIAGSTRQSYLFPASLPTAFAYYSETSRMLPYLPHISLYQVYAEDQLRLLYNTTELNIYRVRIFWDVQIVQDQTAQIIALDPLNGKPPVKAKAGMYASTAQGHFSSRSVFHENGDQTQIDYSLQLQVEMPTPWAMRLIPDSVINVVTERITARRIHEIATMFIERTIQDFPSWSAGIC